MDEFSALAQHVAAGAGDVRGCLIVSRDGLILGEFPDGDEAVAKPAWLRFAALGEPTKGFVEFPDQLWAYVHRGPYAAFAVAEPSVRPGLVMDRLEQALLRAEEARTRREPLRVAEPAAPSGKPRTPLHPTTGQPSQEREVVPVEAPVVVEAAPPAADGGSGSDDVDAVREPAKRTEAPTTGGPPAPADAPATAGPTGREAQRPVAGDDPADEPEVDRVLLAKEFSGLLQMDEDLDDAGS